MAENRGGLSPTTFMGRSTSDAATTTRVLTSNQASLDAINIQLVRISTQMTGFNNSLGRISTLMAESSALERLKERQAENQERILAEQKLREGKESVVERKIQNSLAAPVQKIGAKTQGTLGNLMRFFTFLFTGWLLGKGVQAIKAYSENNKKRLQDISKTVLKGLGIVGGIFAALKLGLGSVTSKILNAGSLIRKAVYNNLFKAPILGLIAAAKGAFKRAKNKVTGTGNPPPSRSPSGGGGGFMPSALLSTGIQTGLNIFQGKNVQESLAGGVGVGALAYLAKNLPLPGPLGILKPLLFLLGAPTANEAAINSYKNIAQNNLNFNFQAPKFGVEASNMMGMGGDKEPPHSANVIATPSAQVSPPAKGDTSSAIGPEPEPRTNVVVTDATAAAQGQQSVPAATGNIADLPYVSSSNSDNFYVLYSQVHYNVVI